jgi:hypothetical protein
VKDHLYRPAFAESEISLPDQEEPLGFEVRELGNLLVTSGKISASDPFVMPDRPPFAPEFPKGRFPVQAAVAKIGTDCRVAFARVLFSPADVHRWEMAVVGDEDVGELKPGHYFGYPVDAGTGCFMDADAGRLLSSRMSEQEDYFEDMIEEMEKTYVHTWSWADLKPKPDDPLNIIAFSSGYGDGVYPTYVGYSEANEPLAIVTDFLILYDEDDLIADEELINESRKVESKWWQFWK